MLWFGSPTFWNATVMMTQVVWSFCSSVVGSLWLRSLLVSLLDMFPKRIMSALFWGTGGGELGDSSSVSRPLLLEAGLDFVLPFGVIGASSFLESSPFSSSSFFCLGTTRHSSVECPFCLWKVHNLLGLKADSQFYVELLIAKECWPWVDGSLMLGCLLLTLTLFLLALYYSFRAATSSLCDAKYEARWIASSSEVGAQTASLLWIWMRTKQRSLMLQEWLFRSNVRSWLWCLWICWCMSSEVQMALVLNSTYRSRFHLFLLKLSTVLGRPTRVGWSCQ